jgi:serine/threonine protein kinase
MAIEAGRQLLHYRLIEKIGEGGMGVVWKALDTTLDRHAAIKILPEALAEDPERLARFELEAKVLATLNHPNIAGIHGFHDADGVRFLAMELVEGTPLDTRLRQGALALDEVLELAGQLAAALEAAHAAGIVHRDLKPANVVLGTDGTAKVLDFGLAKALAPDPTGTTGASVTMSPTVTSAGTLVGTILGTAAYMSPEQARGRAVDQQADIWSFGIVLFEVLTGRRPFHGDTVTDTLAAIVQRDVDWDVLPAATPPPLRRLLRRCLTKDARHRLHSVADARIELEDARQGPGAAGAEGDTRRGGLLRLVPGLVVALVLGALAGWTFRSSDPVAPTTVKRLSIVSGSPSTAGVSADAYDRLQALDISRNGELIVFVGKDQIFLRRMDQSNAVPVPGTEGATIVALSPDGEWLGFAHGGRLRRVPLSGGAPVDIAELRGDPDNTINGIAWSRDGTIYFNGGFEGYSALFRVPDRGGTPEFVLDVTDENGVRRDMTSVQLIDEDRKLLFTSTPGDTYSHPDNARVVVLDLDSGEETFVAEPGGFARYIPSGHLLVARGTDDFLLLPFDLERLEATGSGVPLRGDLVAHGRGMMVNFAFADDGTMVYEAGALGSSDHGLVWFDEDDGLSLLTDESRPFRGARLSTDGKYAAVTIGDDQDRGKLWLHDLAQDRLTMLTVDDHDYEYPVWTPDGQSVIYLRSLRGQAPQVHRWNVRAGEPSEVLLDPGTVWYLPEDVSPDGRYLASFIWDPETDTHWDLEVVSLEGDLTRRRFAEGPDDEMFPRFSPDGNWLAYTSDRSGAEEIYIKRFPERGAAIQVSRSGGDRPLWGPRGDTMYYIGEDDGALMKVEIELGAPPRIGTPQRVADLPSGLAPVSWYPWGHVAPDGRLLLVRRPERSVARINIVLNWFDELRRLAP